MTQQLNEAIQRVEDFLAEFPTGQIHDEGGGTIEFDPNDFRLVIQAAQSWANRSEAQAPAFSEEDTEPEGTADGS